MERNPPQNYTKWTEAAQTQEQDRGNKITTVGYTVDIFRFCKYPHIIMCYIYLDFRFYCYILYLG